MRWTYLAGPALVAAIAVGCSSDSQPLAVPDTAARETVENVGDTSSSTSASSVAPVVTSEAPSSLAFASSRDLGRIYELKTTSSGHESPDSDSDSASISAGTLVQATKARDFSGVLWVKVSSTDDGANLGWVLATDLVETTQVLLSADPDLVGQFRQVRSTLDDDALTVFSEPGSTSATSVTLGEDEIAMHGGNSALTGSGETWIDIVNSASGTRIGWVPGGDVAPLSKSQVRTGSNEDLDRRADAAITYGASLPTGSITGTGCNATQISFRNNDSSRGLTVLFGTSDPIGREIKGEQRWTAPGGTTVYADPGETIVFTLLTRSAKTWYFTALDAEGRATTAGPDADGILTASSVQSFFLRASSCGAAAPPPPTGSGPEEELSDDGAAGESSGQPTEQDPGDEETPPTTLAPSGESPGNSGG